MLAVDPGAGEKTDFESRDPTGDGSNTFRYNNDYFARQGYAVKLVLLGSDAPYLRPSNDLAFTVQVSDLSVSLPTVAG
jgi:hypothetical protein